MRRALPLAAGLAVLSLLWLGPLPGRVSHSFLAHMTMHVGVLAVATPLLAMGLPVWRAWPALAASPAFVLAASLLELIVVWTWHAPAAHALAVGSATGLAAEQASFFLCGLLLWSSALRPAARNPEHAAAGVLALLLTSMHMTLLGALIALAERLLYHSGGHAAVHGLDALQEQQLGGAAMLLAAGTIYLLAGLWTLRSLLRVQSA